LASSARRNFPPARVQLCAGTANYIVQERRRPDTHISAVAAMHS